MTSGYFPGSYGSPFDDFFARYLGGQPRQRIDITQFLSERARELIADAARRASETGSADLDTDHLLWAVVDDEPTRALLARTGADPARIRQRAEARPAHGEPSGQPPAFTPAAKRVLLDAHRISRALGSTYIGPEHLLFALSLNPESPGGRILHEQGVTPETLQQAAVGAGPAGSGQGGGGRPPSNTPTLDEYGRDLTQAARDGRIDPVIGRESEIEQTLEVLARRRKNNPVLIGEAGVGKTAIVEGIAAQIAEDDVPETLRGRRVVELDLTGLVAGTRYRGDFEERLKKIIDEIREHGDEVIVFIDELHTVVGAGASEGSGGAGNMLKPALARGELHIIGATTLEEYRRNIEKDAALERRFQPILVPEPGVEDAVEILRGLRDRYEAHHQVRFTDEALVAAVELSDRYVPDRHLPDKAIDLIDQAGARVRRRVHTPPTDLRGLEQEVARLQREKDQAVAAEHYERASELRDQLTEAQSRLEQARTGGGDSGVPCVEVGDIAEVVSRATGIPVSQLTEEEMARLLHLEQRLHERVIGQDDAVSVVAEAVRRSRVGLGDPSRPIGSFLFLGPTGVGKTELARALAEALFGDEDRMIRLDMSEFQERHTVSRLVGSPPGYVGYEDAGQLTEAVRRRPYSVVLLDEIEKAHPDVFNTLLQVLDDGRLTDSQGRTVDFRNTVVIMTSNLGSELIVGRREPLGFGRGDGASGGLRESIMRRLREAFRPEFLNRIDEIVVFAQLEPQQLARITRLLLDETKARLAGQDIDVEFTDEAVSWLAERGYEPQFGARPLRRAIQREVDNRLSRLMLEGGLRAGQRVVVGVRDGGLDLDVSEAGDREPAGQA